MNPGAGQGGGQGQRNPGGMGVSMQASTTSDYSIFVYGGQLYVNCSGDGLDSNGGLYLYGGEQAVFSMAGGAGMDGSVASSSLGSGQKYVTSTSTYSANAVVNATQGGTVVASYKLPKKSTYTMYSAPTTSTLALATSSSVTACKGVSWNHAWDSGTTSGGVTTYTCTKCGATETQTAAGAAASSACSGHDKVNAGTDDGDDDGDGDDTTTDEGYAVTFTADNATISVYYAHDYTQASETGVTSAVSRNADTGEPDSTGSGQVNFTVTPDTGYKVSGVEVSGSYKNLKDISSDAGIANTYRITKVAGELSITVTTEAIDYAVELGDVENGTLAASETTANYGDAVKITATPADGYELASLTYATEGGEAVDITSTGEFTMPAANVVVSATFSAISDGTTTDGTTTDGTGDGDGTTTDGTGDGDGTTTDGTTTEAVSLASAKLAYTAKIYTGKALRPSVTVTAKVDGKTVTLTKGTDYTVTYKNNTQCGRATVTITGTGNYTGTLKRTFVIKPAKVTRVKVASATNGKATVTWSKVKPVAEKATGYQVWYKVAGASAKKVTVKNASTAKKVIASLAKGKKVTVKVRAYKTIDGKKYYGTWSAAKTATVK